MSFVALFNLSPASIVLAVFGLPVRFGSVPKPAALLYLVPGTLRVVDYKTR